MNIATNPEASRHLPLGGTYNVRDLGGYATADGGMTRWRRVLRADALHRLDEPGRAHLRDAGLKTVIDLRFDNEVVAGPSPFTDEDGVSVHNISLFGTLNRPPTGFPEVEGEDPLLRVYLAALEECSGAVRNVLQTVAEAPEGMVLYHCTAGKDRTGVISALLLLNAGVAPEVVEEDYALTATLAAPMFAVLVEEARARGASAEQLRSFARMLPSEPQTMRATIAHLAEVHGGAPAYLEKIGLPTGVRDGLRRRLVDAA